MISRIGITFPKTPRVKGAVPCIAQLPLGKLISPPSGNDLCLNNPSAGPSPASGRGIDKLPRSVYPHTARQP